MVTGLQAPVTSEKQKVRCKKCKSEFTTKANLKRHEETKHADQSDPAVIEKALKLQAYRKKTTYERRKNDEAFRVKKQQASQMDRDKAKKARDEAEGGFNIGDMNSTDVSGVTDMDETHIIEDSIEDSQRETPMTDTEIDQMTIGSSSTEKEVKNNDQSTGVSVTTTTWTKVTTTTWTTEDMASVMAPKWAKPRSKEQIKDAPFCKFYVK